MRSSPTTGLGGYPRVWIALGAIQLLLVVLGAAHARYSRFGKPGFWLDVYANLSGAGSGYGFFAPGVGSELRATFEVIDTKGHLLTDTLERQGPREIVLREGNIVRTFGDQVNNQKVRRALAASWAGKILARHPSATALTLRIDDYDLPSMQEYARGASPGWRPFYAATFRVVAAGDSRTKP